MSTSTASATAPSNLPPDSRSRPFRRLSQLRSYTQNHFSQSSSSSSSTGNQRSSYRNSLSNRAPWRTSGSHQTSAAAAAGSESAAAASSTNPSSASCPEPERSSSSRSTPTNESGASQTQGTMARLRGLTQTADSRGNNDSISNTNTNTDINNDNNNNRPEVSSPSAPAHSGDELVEPSDSVSPENPSSKPTIRFFPYQDPLQSARPSLHFIPISRTLPSESCVIRVGRYSERDGIPIANPAEPCDTPIGFKSKVVSRRHCELIYLNGQWNVKDVGSSSGTFLNHMRLSQPNMASKLYTVKDGDIVQLGIDFRGGEEMIFRCVRIRIECNRSWQRQPNEFNKNTESLIRNLGKGNSAADYSGCRECSICLGSVLRPYQCLFMAACAHVWHYKCVSRLIHTPDYPVFQCPNCRAYTDLSAEVDDTNDPFEEEGPKEEPKDDASPSPSPSASEAVPTPEEQPRSESRSVPRSNTQSPAETNSTSDPPRQSILPPLRNSPPRLLELDLPFEAGLSLNIENMQLHDDATSAPTSNPVAIPRSANVDIPGSQTVSPSGTLPTRPAQMRTDTMRTDTTRSGLSDDNFTTPRNESGPLVFDGWTGIP